MRGTALNSGWKFLFPFLTWLPYVNKKDTRADLMAALTGAVVVLPQGVAFATIAGMPPQYGLYAGMVPAIIAALFGSSKHLVSGPTTAASVVLFSALSVYAVPGTTDYISLALTLTFMVGVFELALGLARMGALVNFISHSVIVGFTAGAAVLIAAKQLKFFFGMDIDSGGHLHEIVLNFIEQLQTINPWVTAIGLTTLLSGIAFKRWLPSIPYMIAAMLTGSVLSVLLNFLFGPEVTNIDTVGALPATLPPLSAPDLSLQHIKDLAPTALAVTLFALTEAVSIGRSIATTGGYRINGNQEFIGQGLSNIAGAFFSGYVATGSFNRSGLNYQSGARTQLAAIFAALFLMLIVLLVAPYAIYLPKAAMAGILFLVAWGLIDFKEIAHILKSSMRESTVLLVTLLSAMFLELEFAIFAGVLLSLVLYLELVSKPNIVSRVPDQRLYKHAFSSEPGLPECKQLKIVRIEGSLFFGSVNHLQDTFDRFRKWYPAQKHLAIIADTIGFVDLQAGYALVEEAKRREADGGKLYLINLKDGIWDSLERSGDLDKIGIRNIFQSKRAAVHAMCHKLDIQICAKCKTPIFEECKDRMNS